jgi:hypothetical protein
MPDATVDQTGRRQHEARVRHVTFGVMLVVAGVILTIHQLNIFHVFGLWPLLLVGFGISKIVAGCCTHARREGAWLLAFGLWFTINEVTSLRYRDTWPILVVAIGILIVWDAVWPSDCCSLCAEGHHD